MIDFKYLNNYALAGITCIIYKVELDEFISKGGDNGRTIKKQITKLGVKYKKTSSQTWQYIPILENSDTYITNFLAYADEENYCYCGGSSQWEDYNIKRVMPIILVIKNLDPLTSYDVKEVFEQNGSEYEINSVAVTTRELSENKIEIGTVTVPSTPEDKDWEQIKTKFTRRIQDAIDVVNSVTNIKATINPRMMNLGPGVGANSGYKYMINYNPDYWFTSSTIHEMAHNYLRAGGPYDEMLVLELATNSPYAGSNEIGMHTFPEISPYEYLLPELYLIAILFKPRNY